MANPHAGEVALTVNGEACVARLSLGALAELEAETGAGSLPALVARFEEGDYGTLDVIRVVAAGLRAGGWRGETRDILAAEIGGGPIAAAQAAARLLVLAFAVPR